MQWPANQNQSLIVRNAASVVLLALPVLLFFWLWNRYALNIPKWDDHALRAFLYYFDQEKTLTGKVFQLFRQHNEHRIVYDRIVAWLDYQLFGKLHFRHLMVVGNLSLVGLLLVFVWVLRRAGRPLYYAVPISLLLFNLSHWENMYWGMAALQNFSVVLWVLLALYGLAYKRRIGWPVVAAVLATLTSGNGLLVWPLGFAALLLRRAPVQQLIGWGLASVVCIVLYFTGFASPPDTTYVRVGAGALLKGLAAFLGALAEPTPIGTPQQLCMVVGAAMLIGICWIGFQLLRQYGAVIRSAVVRLFSRTSEAGKVLPPVVIFLSTSVVFILITAVVVVRARMGFGADLLITSRYKLYSLTLLCLLYVYGVVFTPGRIGQWLLAVGVLAGLGLNWLSYVGFLDKTIWWRHWLLTEVQFNANYTDRSGAIRLDSISANYQQRDAAFYDKLLPMILGPTAEPPVVLAQNRSNAMVHFTSTQTLENDPRRVWANPNAGTFVVARSAARAYLFPVQPNRLPIRAAMLRPSALFQPGFSADISLDDVQPGTYSVLLLTGNGVNSFRLLPTNQSFTASGRKTVSPTKNW